MLSDSMRSMHEYSSSAQHRVPGSISEYKPTGGDLISRIVIAVLTTASLMIIMYTIALTMLGVRPLKSVSGKPAVTGSAQVSIFKTGAVALHATVIDAVQFIVPGLPSPEAAMVTRVRTRAGVVPAGVVHGGALLISILIGGYLAGKSGVERSVVLVPIILFPVTMGLLSHRLLPTLVANQIWLGCIFLLQVAGIYVAAVLGKYSRIGREYQFRSKQRT